MSLSRKAEGAPAAKVCWHHGDLARLRKCLNAGYCDLYPVDEGGQAWWAKLGLAPGDGVQFSVKGKIVARATIKSRPYDLAKQEGGGPIDPLWGGAVDVADVEWCDGGVCRSEPKRGSHKL